jgi:hypothetical protein
MTLIKFKVPDGVLHVPPREIRKILADTKGGAVVTLVDGTQLRVSKGQDLLDLLAAFDGPATTDTRSLFQMIFG